MGSVQLHSTAGANSTDIGQGLVPVCCQDSWESLRYWVAEDECSVLGPIRGYVCAIIWLCGCEGYTVMTLDLGYLELAIMVVEGCRGIRTIFRSNVRWTWWRKVV